MTTYTISFKYY